MLKHFLTLARGRSADASHTFLDANALPLLRQQLREAAVGVAKSRKAIAVVTAYADREKINLADLDNNIADLENRTRDALDQGAEDMALEAATTIAHLEDERSASRQAITSYTTEIANLRTTLNESEALLSQLKRGQRIAEATDKTQQLRGDMPSLMRSDLADASETLKRLQERQEHNGSMARAMADFDTASTAETLSDRMASAGFGAPKRTAAQDVLDRIKKTTS